MYCTVEDLQKQVNQDVLERVAGDEDGNLLMDVIDYGITQASAEIDAYCSKYCVDMALFHIFSRQGFRFTEESEDYVIYLRYKMALDFLKQVAAGKVDLPVSGNGAAGGYGPGTEGTGNLRIRSNERLFTRNKMGGY